MHIFLKMKNDGISHHSREPAGSAGGVEVLTALQQDGGEYELNNSMLKTRASAAYVNTAVGRHRAADHVQSVNSLRQVRQFY